MVQALAKDLTRIEEALKGDWNSITANCAATCLILIELRRMNDRLERIEDRLTTLAEVV